jgi:hypothetical protein
MGSSFVLHSCGLHLRAMDPNFASLYFLPFGLVFWLRIAASSMRTEVNA